MNIKLTKDEFIKLCTNDNITLKEIQEKTGLSRFLIKKQLAECNIKLKKKRGRPLNKQK